MRIKFVGLLIFICSIAAQAQEPWPQERPDERQQAVINEDGGRSYIVRPAPAPLIGIVKPGASSIVDLQQHSIFLGPGWSDPALRASESRLSTLLVSIRDHAQLDEISRAGITNVFAPTWTVEKLDIAGDRNISDLEIQRILGQILKNGPRPSAESIYLVFLDPTLHSTLGPLVANKHYIAYHGFFNTSGVKIHYAVVPFQSDSQAAYQVALRTLIVAALHTGETSH
jgi:hypothetical protein